MTVVYNDPADFADDQFAGFLDLYSDRLRGVPGGAVSHRRAEPIVAVVVGGGSGHYPAFCGLVGPGLASGAVVGNIFTSPSAAQVYSVAKAADQGRGVILAFGNYAGDVMNFGIAADRLRSEGIDTRVVVVTDDIASADDPVMRRGIAGDFTVFKALGAAAADGLDIDEVEAIGRAANEATRSFGVAFSGCSMPGAVQPLFTVPDGKMGVGLGIHGEPGIHDAPIATAAELAKSLVGSILADQHRPEGNRVAVIVNGLGTTKYEELFLLWSEIAPLLRAEGLDVIEPEVGELVTSLDMGGCSLTLMWLDDQLERVWRADAYTPAYRKQSRALAKLRPVNTVIDGEDEVTPPAASPAVADLGTMVSQGFAIIARAMHSHEAELGRIDAVAGDGDHGRGMVKGADAAAAATRGRDGAGPGWLLRRAGRAWATSAGGTSGVLWGAGLEAAGRALRDDATQYGAADAVDAVASFQTAIVELGGAAPGDKTLLDALAPFSEALSAAIEDGLTIDTAWRHAASAAASAAAATAALTPRKGRARPLAEKSIGTPDAGATSFSLIVGAFDELLVR